MTGTLEDSVSLHYLGGSSDKIYNLFLESFGGTNWFVKFAYGRRGTELKYGTKVGPVSRYSAKSMYDTVLNEKLAKGYKITGTVPTIGSSAPMKKEATVVIDPAEEPTPEPTTVIARRLPQLSNPVKTDVGLSTLVEDDDWMMQQKFDGKRIMVAVEDGKVEASNRKGIVVMIPEEVETELGDLSDCTLDGELVGNTYYAFDILEQNGDPYNNWQADQRLCVLDNTLKATERTYVRMVRTAFTAADKRQMLKDLKTCGGEGAVFKLRTSIYKPGRPASGGDHLKYKFWSTAEVRVLMHNGKHSVKMGVFTNDRDATASMTDQWSMEYVGNVTIPTNTELPKVDSIIEVRYLYAYRNGALYQPTFLGVRDDKDEPDCLNSLKFKDEGEDDDEA